MKLRGLMPILLIIAGLAIATPSSLALARMRANVPGEGSETPWVRYVMVAFGGFRGVLSEILWIRAGELQEEGRYFELVQLSDWITALDPKAIDAWVFNAWNLAYNVTAMIQDGMTRLYWVKAGIDLLENKAIPANPASPRLCRELGWLYQNKIGADDDAAALVYRLDLASEFSSREKTIGNGPGFRLDARTVAEIEEAFGPLDWRLAQSHAIYWAWRAIAVAKPGFERDAARRMVRQNALTLALAGKFTGDVSRGVFSTAPYPGISHGLVSFCLETCREDPSDVQVSSLTLERLATALRDAGRDDLIGEVTDALSSLGQFK